MLLVGIDGADVAAFQLAGDTVDLNEGFLAAVMVDGAALRGSRDAALGVHSVQLLLQDRLPGNFAWHGS